MTIISRHTTLEQLLATSHKELDNRIVRTLRYGRVNSVEQINKNLELVARSLLDPMIDKFGQGRISSGYRCVELNAKVRGAPNSAHVVGLAIDWQPGVTIREAMQFAYDQRLPFDRLIAEERVEDGRLVRWLHLQAPAWDSAPVRVLYESPKPSVYTLLTPSQIINLQV